VRDVTVRMGDELRHDATGAPLRIDYIQLNVH
jgi:hypothetical protein